MSVVVAAAALAALFVVFGLLSRGERRSCHGCPEEDGHTGGCEGCPLTAADPAPRKEVEVR